MKVKTMPVLFSALMGRISVGLILLSLPFQAQASFQSEDSSSIEAEYAYRQKIEGDAAKWAKDLMYMYRAGVAGPKARQTTQAESNRRVSAELAWMMLMGHAALATFDFSHSELAFVGRIPLGSTSRLVASLKRSKNFWLEVRNQCRELQSLADSTGPGDLRSCKEQFELDLAMSQIIGSNVSLFVGGGVVVKIGSNLYRRFASQWVAARVLPLLPAFARSKYVAAGLVGAVIVLPAGYLVASVSEEQRTQQVFLDDLEASLVANKTDSLEESVLRQKALRQEREVLEFALWIGQRLPKEISEIEAESFLMSLRLTAPHYQNLKSTREALEARRDQIERELQAIPEVAVKLQALADARKVSKLSSEDAALFRKAQYLAALRLVLRAVSSDQRSLPSVD